MMPFARVTVIGLGKSNLDDIITSLAKTQGRTVKADQLSDRGFFYRSDQFAFAKLGIPAAYFGSGMDFIGRPEGWGKQQRELWEAKHYHQPSDELELGLDAHFGVRPLRVIARTLLAAANARAQPVWARSSPYREAGEQRVSGEQ